MKRLLLRMLRIVLIAYVTLFLGVAGCQRSLIYYPSKLSDADDLAKAKRQGLAPWLNAKGERIGWRQENSTARHRLVVFHGNAGSASDRPYYVDGFQRLNQGRDWEVFILEYPGYGARAGKPGRDSFREAGMAAVQELLAADRRPLYVLGESIGSGTACTVAGALPDQVAGVILVVPFDRLQDVAQAKFPFLPIGLLLRDRYDNTAAMANYRKPVAVVIGENDEVIGAPQGRKFHAGYAGPKLLISIPGATHNSELIFDELAPWFQEVTTFLFQPR